MTISYLHADFVEFAAGMPAIAVSWAQIKRDVNYLAAQLSGVNPSKPAPSLGDIPMPLYGLAYSVFIEDLAISQSGKHAILTARMAANVHPHGAPDEVIYAYLIETKIPAKLTLSYDTPTSELFWSQSGNAPPVINGQFGPNADAALAKTTIPQPQRDNYLLEVDRTIKWLTGPSFVNLVVGALTRYSLRELTPWLRFLEPLRISVRTTHILVTASRATMTVGDCDPQTVTIEPDPNFPYGEPIPNPTIDSAKIDLAVYVPRTRLFEFFANKIEPAILVADRGGGLIKWSIAGSVGLKALVLDILTAEGLSGVLWTRADVDFVAAARAWVDGPCGIQIGLASASVIGKGHFEAEITLRVDLQGSYVEASLHITAADVIPDWDVHTPLFWPLDEIASSILEHISRNEVRKLVGSVSRIGRWYVLGMPYKYRETLPADAIVSSSAQGLKQVSSVFCLHHRRG